MKVDEMSAVEELIDALWGDCERNPAYEGECMSDAEVILAAARKVQQLKSLLMAANTLHPKLVYKIMLEGL